MARRLALVVGSQCDQLRPLPFVDGLASKAHDALSAAGWESTAALQPLLNPQTHELKRELHKAFELANKHRATLLVWFIGHGVAIGDLDFYLMTPDAPAELPTSESAVNLTQFVRERLTAYKALDGLICLVDACQTEEAIQGASERWRDVLSQNKGRLDMLVASGPRNAYDGCFTATILNTFRHGVIDEGSTIRCSHLQPALSACAGLAQHLAYSNAVSGVEDRGLWLVPNRARPRDAVSGRPATSTVDQLIDPFEATAVLKDRARALEALAFDTRLRLVTGPRGCGKSTLLALFVRPSLARARQLPLEARDDYVAAAVFLDSTSTIETLSAELAVQMRTTVPGFAEAGQQIVSGLTQADVGRGDWQIDVLSPLKRCSDAWLHIIIDGVDQPEAAARDLIFEAIGQLTAGDNDLEHVRLIVGIRSELVTDARQRFAHARTVELPAPTAANIADAVSRDRVDQDGAVGTRRSVEGTDGGWLVARLRRQLGERASTLGEANLNHLVDQCIATALADVEPWNALGALGALAAAGVGPALPIALLTATLGGDVTAAQVRDAVVRLGALVDRSEPGSEREALGTSHHSLIEPIFQSLDAYGYTPMGLHATIVGAYQRQFAGAHDSSIEEDYWAIAGPRHLLGCKDFRGATQLLLSLDTARSTRNRDRWASWISAFRDAGGENHPEVWRARGYLAAWRGASGDSRLAVVDYTKLVQDMTPVLGSRNPQVLRTREYLANWRGVSGDKTGVIKDYENLIVDSTDELGGDNLETLTRRCYLAEWRGDTGDMQGAVADFETLIPRLETALGRDHRMTLFARSDLAGWRGGTGDFAGAVADYQALLSDRTDLLGPNDRLTFITRSHLAGWRGKLDGDAQALADYLALAEDQARVLGALHEDTLNTRNLVADRVGRMGNVEEAIVRYEVVVDDMSRTLGADHPQTLLKRTWLNYWREHLGDQAPIATPGPNILFPIDRFLPPELSLGLSIAWR